MNNLKSVLKTITSNSCPYEINLHSHTTFSDGSLSPIELFQQASEKGIKHIAITDHHSIEGYSTLLKSFVLDKGSLKFPILWSGVEITGTLQGCLVHILALDFNINNKDIQKYLKGISVSGYDLKADSIISAIHNANGLAILAHPARYKINFKDIIIEAHKLGFDGIEVWYNYERSFPWKPSQFICEKIDILTRKLKLLSTCGTDTHGMSLLCR